MVPVCPRGTADANTAARAALYVQTRFAPRLRPDDGLTALQLRRLSQPTSARRSERSMTTLTCPWLTVPMALPNSPSLCRARMAIFAKEHGSIVVVYDATPMHAHAPRVEPSVPKSADQ